MIFVIKYSDCVQLYNNIQDACLIKTYNFRSLTQGIVQNEEWCFFKVTSVINYNTGLTKQHFFNKRMSKLFGKL